MAERHAVALHVTAHGERGAHARTRLADALPDATVGTIDEAGVFEIELEAGSREQAMQRVWEAVGSAGVDDVLVFAEHPEVAGHWRREDERSQW